MASAFGVDDGGEEVLVDVVRGAGVGEDLLHFGWRGFGGGEGRCGRGGCGRRRRVGEGFDAEDVGGAEVLVVVVAGEEEADVVGVEGLVAEAVELETVAERDVFERVRGRGECGHNEGGRERAAEVSGDVEHCYETTRGG